MAYGTTGGTDIAGEPDYYCIRVKGQLHARWSDWFEGLAVTPLEGGETLLCGPVVDQAALHGLLARVRDLNLELLSVSRRQLGRRRQPGRGGSGAG